MKKQLNLLYPIINEISPISKEVRDEATKYFKSKTLPKEMKLT